MTQRVLLISAPRPEARVVLELVSQAAQLAGAEAAILNESAFRPGSAANIHDVIADSSVVVCDLGGSTPNILFELGIATAAGRPVILISDDLERVPTFAAARYFTLVYGFAEADQRHFVDALAKHFSTAFGDPAQFSRNAQARERESRIFVSYSHQDRPFLDRLLAHLRPLERLGILDLFVDTRIKAGDDWQTKIRTALAASRAAVLIISADFLASDFIVNNELPPLLEGAERKGTRIIPLIAKPCRFTRDPNLNRFQAINDPSQPLVAVGECERERVYDSLALILEELVLHRQ